MKCPKCNYTSFDFNDLCPKCGHDLSRERALMGLPSYQPKPIFLLGMLAGNGEESGSASFLEHREMLHAQGSEAADLLISFENLSAEGPEIIPLAPEPSQTSAETQTAASELPTSLEDYSKQDKDPQASIQFQPGPLPSVPETAMEHDRKFPVSLEDLSEDEAPIPSEPEPADAGPEPEIEFKIQDPDLKENIAVSPEGLTVEDPDLVLFDAQTESQIHPDEGPAEIVFDPEAIMSEDSGPDLGGFWKKQAIEQRMADIQLHDLSQEQPAAAEAQEKPPEKEPGEPDLFELELEPLELQVDTDGPHKKTT